MATVAEIPDDVLVVAAILGDFGAFDVLVRRYRAAVVRTAETIVGRQDAEDVAQEALLLAFRALPSIEDPARFAAWLMVITRHRALRYDRQERQRQARRIPLDDVLLEHVEALSQPLLRESDTRSDVASALERIPEPYALVLRLRFFDDMPLKRIAAFLDVPVSTVKWRVYQGKQLLRTVLTQLEV